MADLVPISQNTDYADAFIKLSGVSACGTAPQDDSTMCLSPSRLVRDRGVCCDPFAPSCVSRKRLWVSLLIWTEWERGVRLRKP